MLEVIKMLTAAREAAAPWQLSAENSPAPRIAAEEKTVGATNR